MTDLIPTPVPSLSSPDVRHYVENALSENTRRAYKNDMVHFRVWGGTIPATPEQIASYLSDHAGSLSLATLSRRLVSIGMAHKVAGYSSPTSSEIVRLTLRGIRRTHAKKQRQAAALLKDDLLTILRQMPATPKGARDKALLVLGFAAGLRRSEIVGLDIADIAFVPQGMIVTLRQSKTDRLREGRTIAVPFGRTSVCPVQIAREWLALLPGRDGPLFRPIAKGGCIRSQRLTDHAVSDLVKHYAGKIGLDAAAFSGHSLRAGLVSSCAMAGVASWIIKRTTGHRSEEMVQRYVRPVEAFSYNAAGFLF
jgi:site-specific recombinase XerD